MLMQQRWRRDAVQKRTSLALNRSQMNSVKSHRLAITCDALNGITRTATKRSADANDTMNVFAIMRSLSKRTTLMITKALPTTAKAMINTRMVALTTVSALTSSTPFDAEVERPSLWFSDSLRLMNSEKIVEIA